MIFKNISNDRIEAYGHLWQPTETEGDSQDVTDPRLIRKFKLYAKLKAVEIVGEPKEAEINTDEELSEAGVEILRSQAIGLGLKVDGRWKENRLKQEIEAYGNGG